MERTAHLIQTGKILLDENFIQSSLSKLAGQITAAFSQSKNVTVIVLLDGAKRFADDLFALIDDDKFKLVYIRANSYIATESTANIRIQGKLPNLHNTDVLIVDDIYDTGNTMSRIIDLVNIQKPRTVKTCVLLKKTKQHNNPARIDFYAADIPDCFVIGYGLDYAGQYRDLPFIAELQ
ncbi:MAG: hypothetical protein JW804_09535 [Sedimentisphaerales bacterium]|nr:hypothetical protein [Sedimentisphaerales bacterium]